MVTIRNIFAALIALVLLLTTASSAAAAAPLKILIMGSSTTGCAGVSTPAACYVERVRAARPDITVTSLGRGGTYVGYGTADKNWTGTPIPTGNNIVVIQLGINDWFVPVAPAVMRSDVVTLIDRVRKANPGAAIVWLRTWMPQTAPEDFDERQEMWARHGVRTRSAVLSFGGRWIDADPFGDAGGPYRADSTGWHYNDAGHIVLADLVLGALPAPTLARRR